MTSQPVASDENSALLVYSDSEALQAIASPHFQAQWRDLAAQCPWSTALQSPEFACSWYQCYDEFYRPLILVRYGAGGGMDGLMALAVERASGKLSLAGAHQAEYQVWLALPGEQTFVIEGLQKLRQLAFASLSFTYLPPGTPLEWLQGGWHRRSTIRAVPRPLIDLVTTDAIRAALGRKKNRRRLEKIQAEGPLTVTELHTPDELEAYYDQIIDFYDIRIGALHGTCPFRDDPRKRLFYKALMAREGLLHVAVTRVGGRLFAAHVGIRNKSEVIVVFIGHSPFFAMYSPGKFHTLLVALALHEEGFSSLDLTPGGDAYKDDRATRYDEVHTLTVFFDSSALLRQRVATTLRSTARRVAGILRLDKGKLERWKSAAQPGPLLRSIKNRTWSTAEVRLYRAQTGAAERFCDPEVHRDCLRDLLCYRSDGQNCRSKQSFLRDALFRLEYGAYFYSMVQNNILVSTAWLVRCDDKISIAGFEQMYEVPPNSVLIQNTYTHPAYRREELGLRFLKHIVSDAGSEHGTEFVYIAVPGSDDAARRAIEKTGFVHQSTMRRRTRLGASKTYVTFP